MRCLVSNPKKIRKLRRITGLPVVSALVRGNTDHRYDLKLEGEEKILVFGSWSYYPKHNCIQRDFSDGTFERVELGSQKKIRGGMNRAIPLEDAIKLWEMKDRIYNELKMTYRLRVRHDVSDVGIERVDLLIKEIESLGKKEKE